MQITISYFLIPLVQQKGSSLWCELLLLTFQLLLLYDQMVITMSMISFLLSRLFFFVFFQTMNEMLMLKRTVTSQTKPQSESFKLTRIQQWKMMLHSEFPADQKLILLHHHS